jgi:hypothetical protein
VSVNDIRRCGLPRLLEIADRSSHPLYRIVPEFLDRDLMPAGGQCFGQIRYVGVDALGVHVSGGLAGM